MILNCKCAPNFRSSGGDARDIFRRQFRSHFHPQTEDPSTANHAQSVRHHRLDQTGQHKSDLKKMSFLEAEGLFIMFIMFIFPLSPNVFAREG